MNYEELLNEAYEKLPKTAKTSERFEVPTVETIVQGHQTIIKNFSHIYQTLRRDPRHILKFLAKELATPANFDGTRLILQSKVPRNLIQKKLEAYIRNYVICRECGRPDTKLIKEDRITFLKCEACGAKASAKPIK
ncbi:MAG: translation initiation factor IF-2 subunit beta [Candidatus Aenigmarchaeota archaeon]|nr:translation initiation factor IF-2 subunit beta [Candidatus Aenigmarchaeota archaeon]